MDIGILIIAFLVVRVIVSAVNKNKSGGQAVQRQRAPGQQQEQTGRQQTAPAQQGASTARHYQMAEIQKRLREAYEEAQQQAQPTTQQASGQADDTPPYRRGLEAEPVPLQASKKHHIAASEEERSAEAKKAKQERRKQELRERFGTQLQHAPNRLAQQPRAARQVYESAPQNQSVTAEGAIAAPHTKTPAADTATVGNGMYFSGSMLTQGIIMAEILGPPRAKRKHRAVI